MLRLRRVPAVCGRSVAGGAQDTHLAMARRIPAIRLATTRQDIIHLLATTRLATPHRQPAVRQAVVILAAALHAGLVPVWGRLLLER